MALRSPFQAGAAFAIAELLNQDRPLVALLVLGPAVAVLTAVWLIIQPLYKIADAMTEISTAQGGVVAELRETRTSIRELREDIEFVSRQGRRHGQEG